MPSNQQRREAAKRKLERQLVRRQERAKSRRQRLIVIGAVVAVLVVAGGVVYFTTRSSSPTSAADSTTPSGSAASSAATPSTPCSYPTAGAAKTVKPVNPPTNLSPANTGTVDVDMTLNDQKVGLILDRKAAPCTVNSFLSLAQQGFYNSTDCWRLTASDALNILQCGDPSGKGNGGPGYTFADEVKADATYPAGTVAMANSGANTNGSQFFIVYKDSKLSPQYTVFGKVTPEGLKVVQDIAAKGVTNNAQDGAPVQKATISTVTVPSGAVEATGSYPSASASAAPPTGASIVSGSVPTTGASGSSGAAPTTSAAPSSSP